PRGAPGAAAAGGCAGARGGARGAGAGRLRSREPAPEGGCGAAGTVRPRRRAAPRGGGGSAADGPAGPGRDRDRSGRQVPVPAELLREDEPGWGRGDLEGGKGIEMRGNREPIESV